MEGRIFYCGNYCVFCCKATEPFETNSSKKKTLNQFTILLQRFISSFENAGPSYSNTDDIEKELNWSPLLTSCESCLLIAHNFCEDYNKFKCLELKLQRGLERLVDKIKSGGEVQSNLEQTVNKINEPPMNLKLTDSSTASLQTAPSIFTNYRENIVKICNKRISHSVPRIKLKRVDHQDHHHRVTDNNIPDPSADRNDTEIFVDNNKPSHTFQPDPLELHPAKQSVSATCKNMTDNFKCSKCHEILNSEYKLKCHLIRHHQTWSCLKCSKDFPSKSQFLKHNSQTHKDKTIHHEIAAPVVCRLCDGMFPNTLSLKTHLRMKHKEHRDKDNGWTEFINESAFVVEERQETQTDIVDNHLLERTDIINGNSLENRDLETTSVPECVKAEPEPSSSTEYFIKQETEIDETCGIMEEDITFSTVKIEVNMQNEQNEIDKVTDDSPGSDATTKCHKDTTTAHHIQVHGESNPTPNEPNHIIPSYDCVQCEKSFGTRTKLQRHVYWVHEKPRCSKCEQEFPTRLQYKEHMLTHQESPTFQCSICKRAFTRKILMEDHLRGFHKKLPPVPCSICHKTFKSQKGYGAHMLTVHGENRFHCSECGKGFKKKYHLDLHLVTHQGEAARKFECTACGTMFKTKEALRKHELYAQRKVQNEVKVCRICKKTLANCDSLANHFHLYHPGEKIRINLDDKVQNGTSTSMVDPDKI